MRFLKQVRNKLIENLWQSYKTSNAHARVIETALLNRGENIVLDHLAIIDLPGKHTGIPTLSQIFSALGLVVQGNDYLSEKQNEFTWMVEIDALDQAAARVMPQVVIADFHLDELPIRIKNIIEKYTAHISESPLKTIQKLSGQVYQGDTQAEVKLLNLLNNYFSQRDWPLPSLQDLKEVHEANELLAWTLAFGRIPNHFTIAVHLLNNFKSLEEFNRFITHDLKLALNLNGGVIKGNKTTGIAQSSTAGELMSLVLNETQFQIPDRFMEFVWRYPKNPLKTPILWSDYFTGFVAHNADRVIESLYQDKIADAVNVE